MTDSVLDQAVVDNKLPAWKVVLAMIKYRKLFWSINLIGIMIMAVDRMMTLAFMKVP